MLSSQSIVKKDEKARVIAQKYKKYLEQQIKKQSKYTKCISRTLHKIVEGTQRAWNRISMQQNNKVPISIRGPSTPLEKFTSHLSTSDVKLSLSSNSIESNIEKHQVVLLLTYNVSTLSETIDIVQQSSNVQFLIKNGFHLCPIDLLDPLYLQLYKQKVDRSRKLKGLDEQNHVLVVLWRGIFNQILLLDLFSVKNVNTYSEVLSLIDNRETYQAYIKSMVEQSTECTLQKLSEPTNLTRSTSHSSI